MVRLAVFVALVTLLLMVEGSFLIPGLFRGYSFPEPKSDAPVPRNVVLNTITQQLDNFNPLNEVTWEQRYYSNNESFQVGGHIFVLLSGEGGITPDPLTTSLMADLASDLNGNIFHLEHRFYGQSRPTKDTSNENLRYLTVEQSLADVAHFIVYVTSEVGAADSPVIVIGQHYSGSLAVWFRQKYPHLVTGAWASSAPLQSLVNHQQYKELAGAAYRSVGGQDCYNTIELGFAAIEQYLADGRASEIEEIFTTCDPITTIADEAVFFTVVSEIFAIIPQFDQIYSIRGVCDLITNGTADPVHRIARLIDNALEVFDPPCLPTAYEFLIDLDRNIDWEHPANGYGIRQFSYQTCSQFGWYHSSNSEFQPFGSSFDAHWFYTSCADIFGEIFTEETIDDNVRRFNNVFGALNPGVTNTIFVHGEFDPWRTIGRQTSLNPSSPAFVIRGASQANDLLPITDDDSPQLVAVKRTIMETITEWVRDA